MSNLSTAVQILLGRELTTKEKDDLSALQDHHHLHDDDPIVAILSLLGINKILIETIPEKLRKASQDAIAVHEQTLREQSTLIAKELILTIAQTINDKVKEQSTWRNRLVEYALVGLIALIVGGGGSWLGAKALYSPQAEVTEHANTGKGK